MRFRGVLGFGQGPFDSSTGVLKIRKRGYFSTFLGCFGPKTKWPVLESENQNWPLFVEILKVS